MKSTSVEKAQYTYTYAKPYESTREISILNTTALPSSSKPVTVATKSISATVLSPLLNSNNNSLTGMQDKTSVEVSTTSKVEPQSKFISSFTTKSSVTTTTLEAQHPPSVIIPVKKHTNPQTPMKLPTKWFPVTTRKTLNTLSLTTPVPQKTSRPSILHKTTRKYWFNMNNNTYQPTTVKSPCVTTEDPFGKKSFIPYKFKVVIK